MKCLRKAFSTVWLMVPLAMTGAASPSWVQQAGTGTYHLVSRIPLTGDERWDYLAIDPLAHRLYITRMNHVTVLDTDSNKVIGDISGTQGVHGVALAPGLGKAFISNGKDNSVSVVDLATLKETARLPAGGNPDAIVFEPQTKRVFAFNGHDGTATVMDGVNDTVLQSLPLGGKPEFATVDGHGMVYDNLEDKNQVVAIDARTMTVAAHWALAGCDSPTGQALDRASRRLFAACDNGKLAVVDTGNGRVVALPSIGRGPDAVSFDTDLRLIVVPNGKDGTLSLIHENGPDAYDPAGTVKTETGARTLALDSLTHMIYTITARFGDAPAPTVDNPHHRPAIVPGSVVLLVYDRY